MSAATEPETPGDRPIRVVLADDQRLVRESLATLLGLLGGIELVATASDGEEALALAGRHAPEVILMDLRMPRMDGVEATRVLGERHPEVRVIALTTFDDGESVLAVLQAGARGYLTKDASSEDIQAAIFAVAAGEAALDRSVQRHVVTALADGGGRAPDGGGRAPDGGRRGSERAPATVGVDNPDGRRRLDEGPRHPTDAAGTADGLPDDLTQREAEVLALIAEGLTNAEIAERLVVSRATVKSHINHLFAKAGIRDRAGAVNYAYRNGIVPPPR
ncbi:MAG TPA: response regulator transcription factor [Solirubrobacteraceae bacterium]|nr:response regulator transcription factor [Solirubrobacteraceae bacterium]